jgi:hypothetical protein
VDPHRDAAYRHGTAATEQLGELYGHALQSRGKLCYRISLLCTLLNGSEALPECRGRCTGRVDTNGNRNARIGETNPARRDGEGKEQRVAIRIGCDNGNCAA